MFKNLKNNLKKMNYIKKIGIKINIKNYFTYFKILFMTSDFSAIFQQGRAFGVTFHFTEDFQHDYLASKFNATDTQIIFNNTFPLKTN